jgi:hypothetical protein
MSEESDVELIRNSNKILGRFAKIYIINELSNNTNSFYTEVVFGVGNLLWKLE